MDGIAEWTAAYERVRALTEDIDTAAADTHVPACPAWTVRDLLSHMIGLDADILADDHPDDHNAVWTQAQVDRRAGQPVDALLAEWASLAPALRDWMAANNTRPLGDVIIHEQDLRQALGEPGGRDTDGQRLLRDRMAGQIGERVADRPAIALVSDTWTWVSSGSVQDAAVVLEASEFDLTRALMTRRSAAQLQAWTTRGDVTPYLDAFAGLGPLPERDLTE